MTEKDTWDGTAVARQPGSPSGALSLTFAGRTADLAFLDDALQNVVEHGPLLVAVTGEPGIGKTRLVREFVSRARSAANVVWGRCIDQADGPVPFAPFTTIVRDLVGRRDMDGAADLLPGHISELGWIAPSVVGDLSSTDRELSRGRLFESVLALIDVRSTERPLICVIEDLHWADADSRALLLYLASNFDAARVLLVVTHRPPALGQANMLPTYTAGLLRSIPSRWRELTRLDRDETAEQLRGMLRNAPTDELVGNIYERSGGLPLFTEALVSPDGEMREEMPSQLTDLLLQGVRELPEPCQQVLMALAVAGARVHHPLLCAVTAMNDATLSRAIRPAVQTGLVVADGYGYAFHHDLIRAAVRDQMMLAGERISLNRAFAVALDHEPLREGGSVVRGRVRAAQHWRAAHEHARALEGAWSAAAAAQRAGAVASESLMLEQVLDLWGRVPDATDRLGVDRVTVLRRGADAACWAGRTSQGLAMVEAGLELTVGQDHGPQRAELLMQRASMRSLDMLPGVHDDLLASADLALPDSGLAHEVHLQLARSLWRRSEPDAALDVLDRVTEGIARDPSRRSLELELTAAVLRASDPSKRCGVARRIHAEAIAAQQQQWLAGLAARTWCEALVAGGHYDEARARSRQFILETERGGLGPYLSPALWACLAKAELLTGSAEAAGEAAQDGMTAGIPRGERARLLVWLAAAHLGTGAEDTAETLIHQTDRLLAGADPEHAILHAHRINQLELARTQGNAAAAAATARSMVAAVNMRTTDEAWSILGAAHRALADVGEPGPEPLDDGDTPLPAPAATARAWVAAERARAQGSDTDTHWSAIADQWHDLHRPTDAVYAWCQAAIAAARTDRQAAGTHLLKAVETLRPLNSPAMTKLVDALGRRLNVRAAAPRSVGAPHGLTARELEVLRLVAGGSSNADIARTLFITSKTASVHVSNILRKLDVPNRSGATAAAFRLHLVDPSDVAHKIGDA